MNADSSIQFFDTQFQRQVRESDLDLNPFEREALPHLRGRVLDFGCGLGNLAVAAAQRGCTVTALDASPVAIQHLKQAALAHGLSVEALQADLRTYEIQDEFDAVVSIGLLMFFDCPTAVAQLQSLMAHVRPGGVAVVNVLVEGTTYLDMFDLSGHCLFERTEVLKMFDGWEILQVANQEFAAPGSQVKAFTTVVARKPDGQLAA